MKHRLAVGIILIVAIFLVGLYLLPFVVNWFWEISISLVEGNWNASGLNSYQLNGQANWAWHEHTFQITVVDGQIIQAKCELGYDGLHGESWCDTQFKASAHLVPTLYNKAREMLEFGNSISPRGNCFEAEFDRSNGSPKRLQLDCANAQDEQEEWKITVSEYMP